jgi:exosortase
MTKLIVRDREAANEIGLSTHETPLPGARAPSLAPDFDDSAPLRPGLTALQVVAAGAFAAILLWSYWPVLGELERRWAHDPRYSHGFLVPLFAGYLLWLRRSERPSPARFGGWMALALFTSGAAIRLAGSYSFFSWFDAFSLLVSLSAVVALLGGSSTLSWAGSSIAFLIFMVPLPYRIEGLLGVPLQRMATLASASVLQVFGVPAFTSGNTIIIDDFRIGVIDACNGLGMSYMFLACSFGAVLMIRRPMLDSSLLVASAIPIGLGANIARIVATGLLHQTMGERIADAVYHDVAGWVMMLLALFILWIECKLLPHLFIDTATQTQDQPPEITSVKRSTRQGLEFITRVSITASIAGLLIVAATGLVTGLWTNRWANTSELDAAAARLGRLPLEIGDWKGQLEPVNPREVKAADVEGFVLASYSNRRLARRVGLLLVCGRPGPVAAHTPEVCYPGAGFELAQDRPGEVVVEAGPGYPAAEFRWALFRQREALTPASLRIYWSWNSIGKWAVPEYPRIAFAGRPYLYKLYVIFELAGERGEAADPAETEFIRQLLGALENTLRPPPHP